MIDKTDSDYSLSEVHESVDTKKLIGWKRIFSFLGPAYLVSVGYMDPGNWATDLQGGSKFGYTLIWVLLMSNLMALLLQNLSARLGIVRGRDLAQANRETYPRPVNFMLYILAEIAIAATDLAEVLGMAIGIQLLTGLPLVWGVCITVLDTFLLLYLQRMGIRKMEAFIITLVGVVAVSFLIEIILAQPNLAEVGAGFIPTFPNNEALYIAIGIIGATVMPHNLYLHSALVQTRKIHRTQAGITQALKFNLIDSTIALNIAFFVNAAILILAAAVFFKTGNSGVAQIHEAHKLLAPLLGTTLAPKLFAIALIAAGQSSTITGTLAGQIVMEGYLRLRINPWVRRLVTRLLAIIPALLVILIYGDNKIDALLVLSQVILSLQLGFAIIPLIHFVSDKKTMGIFVIRPVTKIVAWVIAAVLIYLNFKMLANEATSIFVSTAIIPKVFTIVVALLFISLLIYIIVQPLMGKIKSHPFQMHPDKNNILSLDIPEFRKIAVALDFTENDKKLIAYAIGQGREKTTYLFMHVVESASAKLLGKESDDYETRSDQQQMDFYVEQMSDRGLISEGFLGFKNRAKEIVRIVKEQQADMLVVG
ncbi:MAG: Nramp family divalent metal transporter, partial [Bacteroidota bacterium]|nr:Nramp family divalent metal transporter [Bacteroidota bacterium]